MSQSCGRLPRLRWLGSPGLGSPRLGSARISSPRLSSPRLGRSGRTGRRRTRRQGRRPGEPPGTWLPLCTGRTTCITGLAVVSTALTGGSGTRFRPAPPRTLLALPLPARAAGTVARWLTGILPVLGMVTADPAAELVSRQSVRPMLGQLLGLPG